MRNPTFKAERELLARGYRAIVGVDEAGTGALAGPVVAAAMVLPLDSRLGAIRDSKVLSPGRRACLLEEFRRRGYCFASGEGTIGEINTLGIRPATLLAMERAVRALGRGDFLLVDAFELEAGLPARAIIRGDRLCKSIAAASIVAKETRDRIMESYHRAYPDYGFAVHKGYGTALHQKILRRSGPCPIHRTGYAPVRNAASSH